GPASGKAAAGDCDVYAGANAAEAGSRCIAMQRGSGEVACVSGKKEVERAAERCDVVVSCSSRKRSTNDARSTGIFDHPIPRRLAAGDGTCSADGAPGEGSGGPRTARRASPAGWIAGAREFARI